MVCYAIPLAAGIINAVRRKTFHKKDQEGFWLNLLFMGSSIFGVIDHLWNGELFLVGPNIASDLALGATITTGVFVSWGIIVRKEKIFDSFKTISRITGIYK